MILPLRADGLRQSWMREWLEGLGQEQIMASEFASLVALVVPLKRAQLFSDAEMARYNAAVGVSMERESISAEKARR
jgi:hypothetical protein